MSEELVSENKRMQALHLGQCEILEMIVSGAPLPDIMTRLIHTIEFQSEGMLASIVLLDDDRIHVRHGAAPSLPDAYVKAIDGAAIGPKAGSCGTAMFRGKPVIVSDILLDSLWEDYRAVAAPFGLRACWSTPIFSQHGNVLGSFAMYYREPRSPSPEEFKLISIATHLAGIAIERKRVEQALLDNEAKYRSLYMNTPVMMHSIDREGRLVSVSNRWLEKLGYSREDVIGKKSVDFLTPESSRYAQEIVLPEFFKKGVCTDIPFAMVKKDGEIIDVLLSARTEFDSAGGFDHSLAVIVDVTERKRAEMELRKSRELIQSIIDNSSTVIYVKDLAGKYLLINRRYEELFHVTQESILGKTDYDVFSKDIADAFRLNDLQAISAQGPVESEEVAPHDDGPHTYIAIKSPLRNEQGAAYAVCGISTDITHIKRVEEQLRQSQKMEAIGRLAGGIAHDFNNMLTAINGYSAMALDGMATSHPLHNYLQEILNSGKRAASLTRQLLAYSRKQLMAPTLCSLNEIVSDMEKMFRRLIGADVDLVTALDPGVDRIRADRGQIEQILLNLVVNSRDAMPQGGKLTLETANVFLDRDYVAGHLEALPGRHVVLAVSDTGVGMTREVKSKLFEPFFTTKSPGKGTGLGLSVVYGIVKQSGGSISVYSEPGQGTTFRIYFPAATEASEASRTPSSSDGPPNYSGRETVLLVEDEKSVRKFASQAMESQGYKVLEAGDGRQALEILKTYGEKIHLVISDIVMPEMGGWELAKRLRKSHKDLPILFISGYTEHAVVHGGISEVENNFLQKPFSPSELCRKAREILDGIKSDPAQAKPQ